MVEKREALPVGKVIKGLIKAVHSGDYVTISKSIKGQPSQEIPAYLASIQAPKMGSSQRVEEPFAFDARELLRDQAIGRKCEFIPEYNYGGRDYGTLLVDGENLGLNLVKAGLAKVVEKKGALPASKHYDDLISAQTQVKSKKHGVHTTEEKQLLKHTRNVTYFSDTGYSASRLFEDAKGIEKPLEAIVEYVFNASFVTIFIHKFETVAKVSLIHLYTPAQ